MFKRDTAVHRTTLKFEVSELTRLRYPVKILELVSTLNQFNWLIPVKQGQIDADTVINSSGCVTSYRSVTVITGYTVTALISGYISNWEYSFHCNWYSL